MTDQEQPQMVEAPEGEQYAAIGVHMKNIVVTGLSVGALQEDGSRSLIMRNPVDTWEFNFQPGALQFLKDQLNSGVVVETPTLVVPNA